VDSPASKQPVSLETYAALEEQLADAQDRLSAALDDADDIMRGWSDHAEKASYAASIDQLRSRAEYLTHRLQSVYPSDDATEPETSATGADRPGGTRPDAARVVGPGSRVVVDFEGEEETYQIVDERDAWASRGLISTRSPLAQALIGKRAGEVAEYEAPGGVIRVTVVRVE
jgi:transcription elongation factor GreA